MGGSTNEDDQECLWDGLGRGWYAAARRRGLGTEKQRRTKQKKKDERGIKRKE